MSEYHRKLLVAEIPKLNGWLSSERAVQMYDLMLNLQADTALEIGVFAGRSLISQALAMKDNGHGKLYGIDPWRTEACLEDEREDANKKYWTNNVDLKKIHDECVDAVWRFGLQDYVVLIQARSQDCHQIIPLCDCMYIDGNHNPAVSCRDVELYLPKLKKNGYLWVDDCDWPQTQKALSLIDEQCIKHTDYGAYRLYVKK